MGKRKGIPDELLPTYGNVRAVYDNASEAQRRAGAVWYREAHALALELGQRLDAPVEKRATTGAGIIAALSPQTSWDRNVDDARALARGERPRFATDAMVTRAERCARGEDWRDVFGPGPKTRAFAALIEDPADPFAVCVDRHAFDIAAGIAAGDGPRALVMARAGVYDAVAAVYRDVASVLRILPSAVQATTWVAWREAKGIA
jgi:hypothetical protein